MGPLRPVTSGAADHAAGYGRARALVALVASALLAPAPGWGATRTVDGRVADWHGTSTMLGGTAQISAGEYVYQDHVWDDYGADTGQRAPNYSAIPSSGATGDYRYPTDESRYGNNAADLFQVRFAADADTVWILAWMNTLKATDTTVIGIAIDVDPDSGTAPAGGAWPRGAGIATPGADYVVTLWGAGGEIADLATGAVTLLGAVAADAGDNAIEAAIPRAVVPGTTWRVTVASGLWNGVLGEWQPIRTDASTESEPGYGSSSVAARAFNVAFRWNESGAYLEDEQSAALARGDLSAFHADLDLDALAGGSDAPYTIEPGRFYVALFESGFTIPPHHEGTSINGVPGRFPGLAGQALQQKFQFYGRFQPYAIYLPSTYDGATALPLALVLHGIGGSHSHYNRFPGFLHDFGEADGGMILVTPLARGASFYADYGEADVFEVMSDVRARFGFDAERLYLTGYSMGGYGVYRLGCLHPDLFAGAVTWAGYTGEYFGAYATSSETVTGEPPPGDGGIANRGKAAIGDPVDALESLLHLPLLHLAGSNDEIVPTTGQYAAPRRLQRLGYRHRFDLYPGYEHLSFGILDDWRVGREWLGDRRRVERPRRVVYRQSDAWTDPALAGSLGLGARNAWWMRDLEMREGATDPYRFATIDAESGAIPGDRTVARDTLDVAAQPTPNLRIGTAWDAIEPEPLANRLALRLENAASVRIVLAEAALEAAGLAVAITTDGATTVIVSGSFAGVPVTASAGASVVQADGSALVVAVSQSGTYTVVTGTP